MRVVAWKNIVALRGIAMCMVVLNHSTHSAFALYFAGTELESLAGSPAYLAVMVLLRDLTPICIPAFLLASGFISFRFFRGWRESLRATGAIARKYLLWAIPLYLVLSLDSGSLDLSEMVICLLEGGPLSSYWFLVLIAQLYLLAPLLVALVGRFPVAAGFLAGLLQLSMWWLNYFGGGLSPLPAWVSWSARPFLFLPFFLLGMLLSKFVEPVTELLASRRRSLALLCGLAFLASLTESLVLGSLHDWNREIYSKMFSAERIPQTLFALLSIALVVCMKTRSSKPWVWFARLGTASLGVLLMMDLFLRLVTALLWHAPQWGPVASVAGAPPVWVAELFLLSLPLYFIAGVWGPLRIMEWSGIVLGKRVRALW